MGGTTERHWHLQTSGCPLVKENTIAEEPEPYNFEVLSAYQFNKALEQNGWTILNKNHHHLQ